MPHALTVLALDATSSYCSCAIMTPHGRHLVRSEKPLEHSRLLLNFVDELMSFSGCDFSKLGAITLTHGPGSFTGVRIALSVAQGLALAHAIPVVAVSTLHVLAHRSVAAYAAAAGIPSRGDAPAKPFGKGTEQGEGKTSGRGSEEGNEWIALQENDVVASLIDARLGEVYSGLYRLKETDIVEFDGNLRRQLFPLPLASERLLAADHAVKTIVDEEYAPRLVVMPDTNELAGMRRDFEKSGVRTITDYAINAADLFAVAAWKYSQGEAVAAQRLHANYLRDNVAVVPARIADVNNFDKYSVGKNNSDGKGSK